MLCSRKAVTSVACLAALFLLMGMTPGRRGSYQENSAPTSLLSGLNAGLLASSPVLHSLKPPLSTESVIPKSAGDLSNSDEPVTAPSRISCNASRMLNDIPLVYVYFHGEVVRDFKGMPSWSTSDGRLPEYFYYTLAASLLHVQSVILIADVGAMPVIEAAYPKHILRKLQMCNYLEYVDDGYFAFQDLYENRRVNSSGPRFTCCHGLKEPWEKMNFLSFLVLRSWMRRHSITQVAYAEADVAMLMPSSPLMGCESEVLWRHQWTQGWELKPGKPWGAFMWVASASFGNVLSLKTLDDFVEFMVQVYKGQRYLPVLTLRAALHFKHAVNQMYLWFMYAMTCQDEEGKNWSDGKPWEIQYLRQPPLFERKEQLQERTTGVPKTLTLPATRNLKLCNGYFPRDTVAYDVFNDAFTRKDFSIQSRGDQIEARIGEILLRSIHFQGPGKELALPTLLRFLPWKPRAKVVSKLWQAEFRLKR